MDTITTGYLVGGPADVPIQATQGDLQPGVQALALPLQAVDLGIYDICLSYIETCAGREECFIIFVFHVGGLSF